MMSRNERLDELARTRAETDQAEAALDETSRILCEIAMQDRSPEGDRRFYQALRESDR